MLIKELFKSKGFFIASLFAVIYINLWIYATLTNSDVLLELIADTYWLMALFGGLAGLYISQEWGGFSSVTGKAITAFSIGLLFQVFGQLAYTYYAVVTGSEAPYPSIGDIGYFGSIFFYIAGAYWIGSAAGSRVSYQKTTKNKLISIFVPLIILAASYYIFLIDYSFEDTTPLVVLLDFGYPLGQAIYISLAISALLITYDILGGVMRSRIMLILIALILQFLSDYVFLWQVQNELWTPGGINDFMYFIAYYVMFIALLSFDKPAQKLNFEEIEDDG